MLLQCPYCESPNSVPVYCPTAPPLCASCQAALPYDPEALSPYPRLMVVDGPQRGAEFIFDGVVVAGRYPRNPIFIDHGQISRKHVSIGPRQGDRIIIKDLNSANGTFVNGTPVADALIGNGDRLRLGEVELLLRMPRAASAAPAARAPIPQAAPSPAHPTPAQVPSPSSSPPTRLSPRKTTTPEPAPSVAPTADEVPRRLNAPNAITFSMRHGRPFENLLLALSDHDAHRLSLRKTALQKYTQYFNEIGAFPQLMERMVEVLTETIQAEVLTLRFYSRRTGRLRTAVEDQGPMGQGAEEIALEQEIVDACFDDGLAVMDSNIFFRDKSPSAPPLVHGVRPAIFIPMFSPDRRQGLFYIEPKLKERFAEIDLHLAAGLGQALAQRLHNMSQAKVAQRLVQRPLYQHGVATRAPPSDWAEKRQHRRTDVRYSLEVETGGQRGSIPAEMENLSAGGMALHIPVAAAQNIHVGDTLRVMLTEGKALNLREELVGIVRGTSPIQVSGTVRYVVRLEFQNLSETAQQAIADFVALTAEQEQTP